MPTLFVNRYKFTEEDTFSRVSLVEDDGSVSFESYGIEDKVRPRGVKIPGKTAIPSGVYDMIVSMSPRFKRLLPEILKVPNFTGIRIHRGNSAADSSGCLIVGMRLGKKYPIELSALAEKELVAAIRGRKMKIAISGEK